VLSTLNRFAADHDVPAHTLLSTEAVTVRLLEGDKGRYRVTCRNLATGAETTLLAQYLCVTCGILSEQWSAEERGIKGLRRFKGVVTHAGKHRGQDCAVGVNDLTGKRVVIMGSGSFGAEALEAAERSNAEHITVVGRPRHRWILPFSRQYTITAIANAPFLPWSVKSKLALVRGAHSACAACWLPVD
jgi:cation diffusion facilitator CzcD-associated flavoprotein CzcO